MDKALIEIEAVNGIVKAYNRADKNQTRIYGIILGTQKDNIYHIIDVIYGFIFEDEDEKDKKKKFKRLSDENINAILNSYKQKFSSLNQVKGIPTEVKPTKEIGNSFKSYDNLMILGGFVTDKELFGDLYFLYATIDSISNNTLKNINSLLMLVDPNFKDPNTLKYGITTYHWELKAIKLQNKEVNGFLSFKQVDNEVIQNLNTVQILNPGVNDKFNIDAKLFNTNIDKDNKKTINDLLFTEDDKNDKNEDLVSDSNNNIIYIKNKIKQTLNYLNIAEKYLENNDNDGKNTDNELEDLNQIALAISKLEPILSNDEILPFISEQKQKNDNINALSQLLQIQLNLSEKIHNLVKS